MIYVVNGAPRSGKDTFCSMTAKFMGEGYVRVYSTVDYVKIRGYKNNRPVIAFDLDYFNQFTEEKKINKLKCYPYDIRMEWRKDASRA